MYLLSAGGMAGGGRWKEAESQGMGGLVLRRVLRFECQGWVIPHTAPLGSVRWVRMWLGFVISGNG